MRANFATTLDELAKQNYLLVARRGKISHAIVLRFLVNFNRHVLSAFIHAGGSEGY